MLPAQRVNGSPEQTIRQYLDEHGGGVQVPAYHVFRTWQFESFTPETVREIQQALLGVDVTTQPSLTAVGEQDLVLLFVMQRQPAPPRAPWKRYRSWPGWAQVLIPTVPALFIVVALTQ
jgi:hypothetical protein